MCRSFFFPVTGDIISKACWEHRKKNLLLLRISCVHAMATKVKWSGVGQCVGKTCALPTAFHLMKLSNLSLTWLSYNYCYLNSKFPWIPPSCLRSPLFSSSQTSLFSFVSKNNWYVGFCVFWCQIKFYFILSKKKTNYHFSLYIEIQVATPSPPLIHSTYPPTQSPSSLQKG